LKACINNSDNITNYRSSLSVRAAVSQVKLKLLLTNYEHTGSLPVKAEHLIRANG